MYQGLMMFIVSVTLLSLLTIIFMLAIRAKNRKITSYQGRNKKLVTQVYDLLIDKQYQTKKIELLRDELNEIDAYREELNEIDNQEAEG